MFDSYAGPIVPPAPDALVKVRMIKAEFVHPATRKVGEVVEIGEGAAAHLIHERVAVLVDGFKLSPEADERLRELNRNHPAPKPVVRPAAPMVRVRGAGQGTIIVGDRVLSPGETATVREDDAAAAMVTNPGLVELSRGSSFSSRAADYQAALFMGRNASY